MNKASLRKKLRQSRQSIPHSAQQLAAKKLANNLRRVAAFTSSRHISCYAPNDGEIGTLPTIKMILDNGKQCYMPVLFDKKLVFAPIRQNTHWHKNRYGILEPRIKRRDCLEAKQLDLILLPLVGFNAQGHRLGMGGGFYDRTLSFMKSRKNWRKPYLFGLAHQCQEVRTAINNDWDIPMHRIITDKKIYNINS